MSEIINQITHPYNKSLDNLWEEINNQEKPKKPIIGMIKKITMEPSSVYTNVRNKAANYAQNIPHTNHYENIKSTIDPEIASLQWTPTAQEREVFILDQTMKSSIPSYKDFLPITTNKPVCQDLTWSCYNYSWAIMYELLLQKKWVTNVQIDRNYINYSVYKNQLTRMMEELRDGSMKSVFVDDGSCASFYRAIDQWWIIPLWAKPTWKCPVEEHGWFSRDITIYLQKKTEELKLSAMSPQDKIKQIEQLIMELTNYYGNPPKSFIWNEKTYTPQSFQKEQWIGKWDFVSVVNKPDLPLNTITHNNRFEREDPQTKEPINYNISIANMKELMRFSLSQWVPFEAGIDVGEPWVRSVYGSNDTEIKSLIPWDRPVWYNFAFENDSLKQTYWQELNQLKKKPYHEMNLKEQNRLRKIRSLIWDIAPNHVITIIGMKQMNDWSVYYLAHDSGLWISAYGQQRILSEDYLIQNNVWINVTKSIATSYFNKNTKKQPKLPQF